jgi:hypothetical protein
MPNILRIIKKTEQRGQGLVEFALVLPLLLLLVWGVIEFGRILYIYTEVSNAAREAVRYGVARGRDDPFFEGPNYLNCDGIKRAARSTAVLTGLPDGDFEIGYDHGGGAVFGTCEIPPSNVSLGDRLVITITHDIQPLVLLRDTSSLRVMFATARTIVEEGIPVDGDTPPGDDDDDDPIGESPEVTFVLDDPFACLGHLEWTAVPYADSYIAYRTVPTPTQILTPTNITILHYPPEGTMQVENGEEYAVRAFNEFGRGPLFGRDVIAGCSDPSETEDLGLVFTPTVTSPNCAGYFSWRTPPNALGFYLYGPDDFEQPFADVTVPRYPITDTEVYVVANGEKYVVTVYNASGEGLDTSLTIGECPGAPEPPGDLRFVPDQKTPPCEGHLDWNHSTGKDWYEVYRDGEFIAQVTSSRYPSFEGTIPDVNVNQVYTVTAVNETEFGVYSSAAVAVQPSGCYLDAGEVDVRYFLHSVPSPPANHTNAELPFFMTEEKPAHGILYNYNDPDNDPIKPGREVMKGGGTPPGEADPQKYIEWRTAWDREHYPVPLTIRGDVTVTLWAKNPANQQVVGRAYLYELSEGGYTLIAQTYHTWAAGVIDWQPVELTFPVSQWSILDDGQLVVWVISDNAKSLHFAYDTTVYPSKIGFSGSWDSE